MPSGRRVLSTWRQPFALGSLCQGLCRYRAYSLKYKFKVDNREQPEEEEEEEDEEGALLVDGPPSRVFLSHLPESYPKLGSYASIDHPLLNLANLHKEVASYFILPVFEPQADDCAGILEIVLIGNYVDIGGGLSKVLFEMMRSLQSQKLKTSYVREFLQKQTVAGLQNARNEINDVLETARESHKLPLAQAWIGLPYIHKNPTNGGVLIHKLVGSCALTRPSGSKHFSFRTHASLFSGDCELRPLTEGEGLIGNVLSTHKPYFCEDVSLLSLTDYPFSRYAKDALLTSCFAICLRSTLTGNLEYVLELFLPSTLNINTESEKRQLQALLSSIMNTMKQHFRTFKFASGEQLGEQISIRLIRGSINCQVPASSFNICQATSPCPPIATQALEPEGGVEVAQQIDDPMEHAPNTTLANAEQSDTMMQRTSSRISLTLDQIQSQYRWSMEEAAGNLGVSRSTLKRECRRLKIDRWPNACKRKKLNSSSHGTNIERGDEQRGISTDHQDMNDPGSSSEGGQVPSFGADIRHVNDMTAANDTPTFQNNISTLMTRSVTMEVAYGDNTIRFPLLTNSSTMADLKEEILKRQPPLRELPFSIKYEDDRGKLILIACDEDLQDLMSRSSNKDEVKLLVQKESGLTVKASYGDETIKFQLSSSSTFASVQDKIAKSLIRLQAGTFKLKYKDEEGDWISITSDEDLQECMSSSRGLNRTTIRMSVELLPQNPYHPQFLF